MCSRCLQFAGEYHTGAPNSMIGRTCVSNILKCVRADSKFPITLRAKLIDAKIARLDFDMTLSMCFLNLFREFVIVIPTYLYSPVPLIGLPLKLTLIEFLQKQYCLL